MITKTNRWTLVLAAAGVVSYGSFASAEEAKNQVLTALSSTTLSGYVSTSAIWKLGTGDTVVGRAFDGTAKQDGFNLDVVKLSLEKPLDEAQWSAGYKIDLLFGPDSSLYNPSTSGITPGAAQDFGIKQAYVVLRAPVGNGLDFKLGTFDTCIGYEVFDSVNDPNYSRSYGYTIEPLAHTGLLASYTVAPWLSVSAGIANTWGQGVNARPGRGPFTGAGFAAATESEKTYLGLITLTAPESLGFLKGATLTAGIINGLPSANGPTISTAAGTFTSPTDITSYYVGATAPTPLTGLSLGLSYDYRGTKGTANYSSSYANAASLYLLYQATEKLKFSSRSEYATGSDGTWYASRKTADRNNALFGETFTVDYSIWANVVTRAELRWDHDLAARGATAPFGNDDKNALSLALNVIYKF